MVRCSWLVQCPTRSAPAYVVLMRRLLGVAAAVGSAGSFMLAMPASAACDGPSLRVTPARSPAGSRVTVSGEGYMASCEDMQTVGQPRRVAAPDTVRLLFKQGELNSQRA